MEKRETVAMLQKSNGDSGTVEVSNRLLSKVIDENRPRAIFYFGIQMSDLSTSGEREIFQFIIDYAAKNNGKAPRQELVTEECPSFVYTPNVTDSFNDLVRAIKIESARVGVREYLRGKSARAEILERQELRKEVLNELYAAYFKSGGKFVDVLTEFKLGGEKDLAYRYLRDCGLIEIKCETNTAGPWVLEYKLTEYNVRITGKGIDVVEGKETL